MNKNKGFTLIELLAVIVILAILMVVAVPKILNVIENSRKSAAESSIKLVKDAIRSQVTSESMMGTNFTSDESGCYTFNFDEQISGNAKELQLKNKENITGTIKYCNGNFTNNTLVFDGQDMKTIVCKRATKLHTESCTQTDSTNYCSGAGLTGKAINYGNLGTKGTLKSGDAFDCDVNGDGTYDENTERFYYVSDYYNTSTNKFEDDTAVLIYYNNVSNGKPSASEWRNVSLISNVRSIVTENGGSQTAGGPLPVSFSYAEKAARLLTVQEINKACNITVGTSKTGELDICNYLMENTMYSNSNIINWGYWIENPYSNNSTVAWHVTGRGRGIGNVSVSSSSGDGTRPAIEVLKSNIEY